MTGTRINAPGWREPIAEAERIIGPGIMRRLSGICYVAGVSPVFAGIHRYTHTYDGRSYNDTPHVAYPFHIIGPADRKQTTICLPTHARHQWIDTLNIIHELGHALHETIAFNHNAHPVSDYAKTNQWEAFAEAFTVWAWGTPPGAHYRRAHPSDLALFNHLSQ